MNAERTMGAGPPVPPGGSPPKQARVEGDARVFQELVQRLAGRTAAFARYRVEAEVAKGGMGAILRVLDVDLRRDLAMKVMLQQGEGRRIDERLVVRFAEEAQITGQLEHPGIVPVHDLGLDDQGRMYFTMRLVRGRDFEQILGLVQRGADEEWTLTRAVDVLLKVCEAMAYAHSKHVIHRDLKPANVMVGHFGEVYVMDWGLARLLDVLSDSDTSVIVRTDREDVREAVQGSALLTMAGDVMGTPTHMSPEQARGDLAAMGPASDIYSTGAILYHLLAGHAPYGEPGASLQAADVWKRVKSGPPPPIEQRAPEAPPELCAICERAMAREIHERYPSMQAMGRDLRAYLEGRVVGAYETGAVAEFKKWVRRNRALALTSLAAGVIIVSGLSIASVVLARKNTQLSEITAEAVASADLAAERAAKVLRLSDVKRLQQLAGQADALWPAHPGNAEPMRLWLASARDVLGREGLHLAELARLRGLAGASVAEGHWTFANTEDQWQHDTLVDLTADLARLRDPELGLVHDVEARLRFAEGVEEQSRSGPEARALWDETRAALGDRSRHPAYAGLELAPQLGLLPLGPDPRSGLLEFAHLQTGAPARRSPADGALEITAETGLVFVLLPGGAFHLGQPTGPQGEEPADPEALAVELAPFFVSKYEMTQGQWLRFTGENPSRYQAFGDDALDRLHPVEQVSWFACREVLAKLALDLPSEAQWEYAARAGTEGPWWTGSERESLRDRANLADQSAGAIGALWSAIADWPDLDDGYPVHAPVNAFGPNPFGLHQVVGNVWEWCREPYAPGYGDQPTELYMTRGGSFQHTAALAKSSHRNPTDPGSGHFALGVRPVRAIDP